MGRIRTSRIKNNTQDIIESSKGKFKTDFEHNKKVLDDVSDIPSKHLRNVIAGYITKLMNQQKEKSLK